MTIDQESVGRGVIRAPRIARLNREYLGRDDDPRRCVWPCRRLSRLYNSLPVGRSWRARRIFMGPIFASDNRDFFFFMKKKNNFSNLAEEFHTLRKEHAAVASSCPFANRAILFLGIGHNRFASIRCNRLAVICGRAGRDLCGVVYPAGGP